MGALAFMLSLLLPSAALAAECPETGCPLTPTNTIQGFDEYLNGITEPGYSLGGVVPADELNKSLKKSHIDAKEWHTDSFLAAFNYHHNPGSMDTHKFFWLSPSNETKMLEDPNWTTPEEKANFFTHRHGIFRVPMRMRDLTKAMIQDEKLLPMLDKIFGNNSIGSISFSLTKNSANRAMWYINFTHTNEDPKKDTIYQVRVSAETKQNPDFMVFHINTPS